MESKANKTELIFVTLANLDHTRRGIYNNILTNFSSHYNKIHVICLGKREKLQENNVFYQSGNLLNWMFFFYNLNHKKIKQILITDYVIGGFISLIYSKLFKIPLYYRCGGLWKYEITSFNKLLKSSIAKILKPIIIKNCQKVIYNSKAIVIRQIKHSHAVVYNGVDTSLFKPLKLTPASKNLNVLYIGRINKEKGLDYLFKAVGDLKNKVHLGIAGEGPFLDYYKKKIPFAKFYGKVNHTKLPSLINTYGVIILPSLINSSESFPNALLEAMACGKPVIATHVYGTPEMVTHKLNGFLVPPKNSKAIKKAINKFLEEPKLIETMGITARKIVKERFEKEKQMHKLYNAILNKKTQ